MFFTTTDYNFFIQDTWTVSPQLTLNLGLRYEYQKLPQPGDTEVRGVVFTGNPNYPLTQSFNQDKNNWGPRFGFTYDFGGNHTTIVKGGYGIYFGRTSNSVHVERAHQQRGDVRDLSIQCRRRLARRRIPNVLGAPPTTPGSVPAIQYLSPDLERPEIHMGDVTFERELAREPHGLRVVPLQSRHAPAALHRHEPPGTELQVTFVRGRAEPRDVPVLPRHAARHPDHVARSRFCDVVGFAAITVSCCRRTAASAGASSST